MIFLRLALVVLAMFGWMLTNPLARTAAIAYSLILDDALGNVIDCIHRGYVVDLLNLYWQSWHWLAFPL